MLNTVPPSRRERTRQKVSLPWRGLRGEALNAALIAAGANAEILSAGMTAVPTAVFCHPVGFVGGHGSKEACLEMARLLL